MGHRMYDPRACRFINRDPIGYDGGVNQYAYCENNPITNADPSGLRPPTATENNTLNSLLKYRGDKDDPISAKQTQSAYNEILAQISQLPTNAPLSPNIASTLWAINLLGDT